MKKALVLATALTLAAGPSIAQSFDRSWALMVFVFNAAGSSVPELMTQEACEAAAKANVAALPASRIDATCTDVETGEVLSFTN